MATKYLALGKRNQVTLPRDFIPEGTIQLECKQGRNGEILLVPCTVVPVDQQWFWTPRWQEGERQADEDIKAGRVSGPYEVEELLAEMNKRRHRRKSKSA